MAIASGGFGARAAVWVSALATLAVAARFGYALLAPLVPPNVEIVAVAETIVIAEFLAMHAGGFALVVAGRPSLPGRVGAAIALIAFYGVFLWALWVSTHGSWVVSGVALLIVIRFARGAFAQDDLRDAAMRAGLNLALYFGLLLAFFMPFRLPQFGFTPEVLAQLGPRGAAVNLWPQEPQRAVAWCALYFLLLGLFDLLSHLGSGAAAAGANWVRLGREGPRLWARAGIVEIVPAPGSNRAWLGLLVLGAMFAALVIATVADAARGRAHFSLMSALLLAVPALAAAFSIPFAVYRLGRRSGVAIGDGALRYWVTWCGFELRGLRVDPAEIVTIEPNVIEQVQSGSILLEQCSLLAKTREGELEFAESLPRRDAESLAKLVRWLLEFNWDEPRLRSLLEGDPELRTLLGVPGACLLLENRPRAL